MGVITCYKHINDYKWLAPPCSDDESTKMGGNFCWG